jgi:hypothetical protein
MRKRRRKGSPDHKLESRTETIRNVASYHVVLVLADCELFYGVIIRKLMKNYLLRSIFWCIFFGGPDATNCWLATLLI